MAHLPLLRRIRINSYAESEHVETDLQEKVSTGRTRTRTGTSCTPEVALDMGAIGYVFGSRLQRALQIPIGIIDNARGGASLESLVPRHKFDEHPHGGRVPGVGRAASGRVRLGCGSFRSSWQSREMAETKTVATQRKKKGVARTSCRPNRPDETIRSWSVPGRSPSDAASCYNGMFGVFKGLNIKGVAFHQGFNNAMMNTSCKPKFYRVLMKLMVDGWREDFNDPQLPVAIIGLCAGGNAQTRSTSSNWASRPLPTFANRNGWGWRT